MIYRFILNIKEWREKLIEKVTKQEEESRNENNKKLADLYLNLVEEDEVYGFNPLESVSRSQTDNFMDNTLFDDDTWSESFDYNHSHSNHYHHNYNTELGDPNSHSDFGGYHE